MLADNYYLGLFSFDWKICRATLTTCFSHLERFEQYYSSVFNFFWFGMANKHIPSTKIFSDHSFPRKNFLIIFFVKFCPLNSLKDFATFFLTPLYAMKFSQTLMRYYTYMKSFFHCMDQRDTKKIAFNNTKRKRKYC